MAVTNDPHLIKRMRLLRSHGLSSDATDMRPRPPDEIWNYQQIGLGFNYRMTDIQAALGLSQMLRLDEFVARRHATAQRYDQLLSGIPVLVPWQHAEGYSSYHLYVIRLKLGKISKTHRQVYEALGKADIQVNLHYIPVYRQPYYEHLGFSRGYCPQAEKYYSEAITIPMHPSLTESQQNCVIESLKSLLSS